MTIQEDILEHTQQEREQNIKRNYPLFSTTRLKRSTLTRLKTYGKYGDSIDDCITTVLDKLERGYEIPKDNRSF